MSNFKEFIDELKSSPITSQSYSLKISEIQQNITAVIGLATSSFWGEDKAEKFSKEVSKVVQNELFLAELSNKIGEPLDEESEDDFVLRSTDILKQMLHKKFRL
jgi:hypothetical protein